MARIRANASYPTLQETEEGTLRVSTLQQQAPNLSGAYSVCSQASVPRISGDEYLGSNVHQSVRRVRAVRGRLRCTTAFLFFHFSPSTYLVIFFSPTSRAGDVFNVLNFGGYQVKTAFGISWRIWTEVDSLLYNTTDDCLQRAFFWREPCLAVRLTLKLRNWGLNPSNNL